MRLKKGNVEREADGIKAERLLNDGFTRVEAVKMQSPEVSNKKDLSEMTAEELKNLAKEKGISGASALTKAELQEVLNDGFTRVEAVKMQSPEVSNKKDLSEMTAEELKNLAKEKGISGASALTKAELQEVLKDVV